MKAYLDAVVVIYLVERRPAFGPRATAALNRVRPTQIVVTDLLQMECLVWPRRQADVKLEADFLAFLNTGTTWFAIESATFHRATDLRAKYPKLKTPDALHLAAAIESGCDVFVTNDAQLRTVTEIRVEVI
jgi:uncharacterized protein